MDLASAVELNNGAEVGVGSGLSVARQLNPSFGLAGFGMLSKFDMAGLKLTRNTADTVEDYNGNPVSVPAGVAAFRGARYDAATQTWHLDTGTAGEMVHPVADFEFIDQASGEKKRIARLANYQAWPGATTGVALGKRIAPGNGTFWECTAAGDTGGTEPADWSDTENPITDGAVVWTYRGIYQDEIGLQVYPASTNLCECYPFPLADEVSEVEEVANGGFDTDSVWTKGAGVVISGGVATADSASLIVSQVVALTLGRVYRVSFDYEETSSLRLRLVNGGIVWTSDDLSGSGSGSLSFDFAAEAVTSFSIEAFGDVFSGSIDNVSVREIKHAIGTKATLASTTAIEGFTVSGASPETDDSSFYIRAATAAENEKFGGLAGWASKMYEVDNGTGTAVFNVVAGGTHSATDVSLSVWAAVSAGEAQLATSGSEGAVDFSGASLTRVVSENISSAGNSARVRAKAGCVVAFAGLQDEEVVFTTPLILTDGAAAVRNVTVVEYNKALADYFTQAATLFLDIASAEDAGGVGSTFFLAKHASAANRFFLERSSANTIRAGVHDGTDFLYATSAKDTSETDVRRCVCGYDGANIFITVDGETIVKTAQDAPAGPLDGINTVGSWSGLTLTPGLYKNMAIVDGIAGDSALEGVAGYD